MDSLRVILKTEWQFSDSPEEFVREVVIWCQNRTESDDDFRHEVHRVNRRLKVLDSIPVESIWKYCFECFSEKFYNVNTDQMECVHCED